MEKKKEIILHQLEARVESNQIVENGLNKHTSESLDNALVVGSNNKAGDDEINSKLPEDISTTIDSQVEQHETVLKDDENKATKLTCEKDSSKDANILSFKQPIILSTSTMGNAAVNLNSKASSENECYKDLEKQENTKITLMEFLKETSDMDDPKEKYIEQHVPSPCIASTELLGVNEGGDNVDHFNTNQFKTTFTEGLVNSSNKSLDYLSSPPSDVEGEISKTNLSRSLKDAKECTDSANKTDALEITPIAAATHESTNSDASLHEEPQNIIDREKHIMECMRSWQAKCVLWRPASVINSQNERRQIPSDSLLNGIPEEHLVKGSWPGHRETANKLKTRTRVLINSSHELRESKGWSLATLEACGNLTHLTLVGCGLKHMHGIHSCRNLRHLDISHNKISALSLAGMYRLQSLVAVDNRFTSTNGMRGCTGLLHCDLSHNNITRVAGMEDCINLLHLRLSHNQLIKLRGVESLRSLILLQLSTNHLSSLDGLQHSGLLRYLDISSNNFTKLPFHQLSNLVLLDHLNLSANYISEIQMDIETSYVWSPCLTTLNLSGNKVSEENFDLSTLKTMPLLQCLDLSENLIPNVENINNKIKNLNITVNWFATEHRQKHPVFEILKSTKFTLPNQLICLRKVARYVSAYKQLLSDEKAEASTLLKLTGENQLIPDFISFHCDYLLKHCKMATKHRSWLENKEAMQENSTQKTSENSLLTNSTKYEMSRDINNENVTGEGTKGLYRVKEKVYHKQVFAAVKIQALWRMYVAKQRYQAILTKRTKAAVTIQSLWRGYLVRTSVAKALASFKNEASDDSSEEFEEVDISALQFDEHQYDHKWAYSRPLVPNIPSPVESRTELKSAQSDYEYERSASMLNRTPLPPIGTANSEGAGRYDMQNYDMTNQLSSRSSNSTSSKAKSDLANQWGIQNSETSDLLLRRQRRLKGKRSQLPGAEDKLRRFQQMKNKLPTFQTPSKKPCSRVDYFKAQESGFHKMNKTSDSDERRSQYTYQWLHSEVNFPIAPKPPVNPSPRNRILLPNIGTPPASKQDHMEILSVSSLSSSRHRSHHLLQDIVRRHPA